MQNLIKSVAPGSPAAQAGIRPGDRLVSVDGNAVADVLDYMYFSADEDPEFVVQRPDGSRETVSLSKDDGRDAGLEFETYLMDTPRSCANNCIFCFVDQMPKGMRPTLYFKDDDVRLSFLTGSYITLTNMTEREVRRVIALRISPINVSVHSTDPALRCRLLGNRNAGKGLVTMRRFAKAGIEMNCQIVCCPGINDGDELTRTMRDLAAMYPAVPSVSVVPVGLTKYRENLPALTPFDREKAAETVARVEAYSALCLKERGSRIFFCSDELYLKAGLPIPDEDFYEGYPQLENGVGLIRLLRSEFCAALAQRARKAEGTPFSIACGVSAAPALRELLDAAKAKFPAVDGRVFAVENDFFGHTVDVTGLVTGGDLIAQLRGKALGKRLLITDRMLRHGGGVFLDDVTTKDVENALGVPVEPVPQDGAALLDAMLE